MYYWKEKYENIWDSAPRPKYRGSSGSGCGSGTSGQCVCKDKPLRDQLDRLLAAFSTITTEDVRVVATRYMSEDICCCKKNYCKHADINVPDSELDSDMWDLYTFFLNEFNTKDMQRPEDGSEDSSPTGGGSEPAPTNDSMDVTTGPIKDDLDKGEGAEGDEDDDDPFFGLFDNDYKPMSTLPQSDPLFKVKIMEAMKDCMLHRDIHRFYLLQHTKLIIHFFHFHNGNYGNG